MNLTGTARGRLFFFGALYFAQGVPWGFIATPLAIYLTTQQLGEQAIGEVLALSYLPWSFKLLLAPLADGLAHRLGGRRPWILAAQMGMAATLLALSDLDPRGSMPMFLGLIFLHNAFAAAQDVGVDALAVEILGEHERGTANSVMWSAKYLGVAVGGKGFASIGTAFGWRWLFLAMTALILVIAILPLLIREPPRVALPPPPPRGRFRPIDWALGAAALTALGGAWPLYHRSGGIPAVWYVVFIGLLTAVGRTFLPGATALRSQVITTTLRSFALRSTFFGLVLFLIAPAAAALLGPMSVPLYKNQLGYSDDEISTLNGLVATGAGAVGALAGGILSDRIGRRRAIAIFSLITASAYFAFGALTPLWSSRPFLYGFVVLNGLVEGMLQATFLPLAMDLSNPAVSGTHFTAYMAAQNWKLSWASWVGGLGAGALGPSALYMVAAAVQALPLLLLPLIDPEEVKRAFRRENQGGDRAPEAGAGS